MRRNRVIYGMIWILSLVGISFFGGPVSYGFFALLSFGFPVSFLYVLCVHLFFRIYQELETPEPVAGEAVPFHFLLRNEYFFGFAGIRVRFFHDFSRIIGLEDHTEYELIPGTGLEKHTEMICRYRGEYEAGIRAVEIQDYFRLFTLSFRNHETLKVRVKPRILFLESIKTVEDSFLMARVSAKNGENPDILTRKYEAGDDFRRINWKASAKNGDLLVRKSCGEEQEGVKILMSAFRSADEPARYLPQENKMLELAIALTVYLIKKKIPVGFFCPLSSGEKLDQRMASDMQSFGLLYEETFCNLEFDREKTEEAMFLQAQNVPELFRAQLVFLILPGWSAMAEETVRRLQEEVFVVAFLVNDRSEESMPAGFQNGTVVRIRTDADLTKVL